MLSLDLNKMCFLHTVSVLSDVSIFGFYFNRFIWLNQLSFEVLLTTETKRYNPVKQ